MKKVIIIGNGCITECKANTILIPVTLQGQIIDNIGIKEIDTISTGQKLPYLCTEPVKIDNKKRYLILFPTRKTLADNPNLQVIEKSFEWLVKKYYHYQQITSILIPPVDIETTIALKYALQIDLPVYIYTEESYTRISKRSKKKSKSCNTVVKT